MESRDDWEWKIREAIGQVRTRYERIGRMTGAPFLAIVHSPEIERAFLKEWRTLVATLAPEYSVRSVDVLSVTSRAVHEVGLAALTAAMADPMPGADPSSELGALWTTAVARAVREAEAAETSARPVIVIERLAALHPVSTPHAVMQALWDSDHAALRGPVVLLIPGVRVGGRAYRFLGLEEELMYRGDIL
jgi:hypothetical protein